MSIDRDIVMATISDVAREAKVSSASVSRALNNKAGVSPALAERVRAAADKLGYTPNAAARNLRRQETKVWALIVPDITNPFFTSVAHGVSVIARKNGYKLLLCNSEEDEAVERDFVDVAIQEQAAGVVFAPHRTSEPLERLRDHGIPVVVIDRTSDPVWDTVATDSRKAAYDATVHLIDQGWSRPACITGPESTETASRRLQGYLSAMESRGLQTHVQYLHTDYTIEGGRIAASRLLSGSPAPDALLIASSTLALGVLMEARSRDLHLGVGLGLISFDESPWAPVIEPPMSVIAQPAFAIGEVAGTLLVERIGASSKPRQEVILSAELMIRQSSLRHLT